MRRFILWLTCFISLAATSCMVMKHTTPTHNTPHFTAKNQFELNYSLGLAGSNLNVAYTPVKYLSLQANAYGSRGLSFNHYNYIFEGAIGGYLPLKKMVLGITGGYGRGSIQWERTWFADVISGELLFSRSDTWYTYIDAYFSGQPNEDLLLGFSTKLSFFNDFFHESYTYDNNFEKHYYNYSRTSTGIEALFFFKERMIKNTFVHGTLGLAIIPSSYMEEAGFHPIIRIGLTHKF